MDHKAFCEYLATGRAPAAADSAFARIKSACARIRALAEDAEPKPDGQTGVGQPPSLASHDLRFHQGGYKEGDACKYRESLAKGDKSDENLDADAAEMPAQRKFADNLRSAESVAREVPDTGWYGLMPRWQVREDARAIVEMLKKNEEAAKTIPRAEFDEMMDYVSQKRLVGDRSMSQADYDWLWNNARAEAMTLFRCYRGLDMATHILSVNKTFDGMPMFRR